MSTKDDITDYQYEIDFMKGNIMASKPKHTIRAGCIQLSVWENETKKGTFYTISIDRSYKNGEEWETTKNFRPADIALVQLVLNQAMETLYIKADKSEPSEEF